MKKIFKILPKISFNRKKSVPVLIRIDFACCKRNKGHKSTNYFVNEIESEPVEGVDVLPHLRDAYELLKNRAGYASITETTLLANGLSYSNEKWPTIEIGMAIDHLTELARNSGEVRIASDRFRRPEAFRVSPT